MKNKIMSMDELANSLNCEELCVLSKKKDFLGSMHDKRVRVEVNSKRAQKSCPICH